MNELKMTTVNSLQSIGISLTRNEELAIEVMSDFFITELMNTIESFGYDEDIPFQMYVLYAYDNLIKQCCYKFNKQQYSEQLNALMGANILNNDIIHSDEVFELVNYSVEIEDNGVTIIDIKINDILDVVKLSSIGFFSELDYLDNQTYLATTINDISVESFDNCN